MKSTLFVVSLVAFVNADDVTTPACVEDGSDVVVGFENDNNAETGDWLGLYPVEAIGGDGAPGMPALHPMNWVNSCGDRSCTEPKERGPVLFPRPKLWVNADGSDKAWVAVLARFSVQSQEFYTIVNESAPFIVSTNCAVSIY